MSETQMSPNANDTQTQMSQMKMSTKTQMSQKLQGHQYANITNANVKKLKCQQNANVTKTQM